MSEYELFFQGKQVLERIFFLYGATDDSYAPPHTDYNNFEQVLEQHLVFCLGYELVLFYNGINGLYCYRQEMADRRKAWFEDSGEDLPGDTPEAAPETGAGKQASSLMKLFGAGAPKANGGKKGAEKRIIVNDNEVTTTLDRVMRHTAHKCCIVFSDGWDLIDHTENDAMRTLTNRMQRWYSLDAENANIAIILFGRLDYEHINTKLRGKPGWGFLSEKILSGNGYTDAVKRVGAPGLDEMTQIVSINGKPRLDLLLPAQRLIMSENGMLKDLVYFKQTHADWAARLGQMNDSADSDALQKLRETYGWESAYRAVNRMLSRLPDSGPEVKPNFIMNSVERLTEHRQGPQGTDTSLAMVLKGNPGTGKTEIAKLLGRIFQRRGLLPSGHLVKATRESLVGEYIGHTAVKTRKMLDMAEGGVLFVDEAYSLYRGRGPEGSHTDFGIEAVETILERMSASKGRIAVVMAGYPDEMEVLLDANPGLRSRFGANIISIEDYPPPLLQRIFQNCLTAQGFKLDEGLGGWTEEECRSLPMKDLEASAARRDTPLKVFFHNWHASRDRKSFGNARASVELAQEVIDFCRTREKGATTILREDFPQDRQGLFINRQPTLEMVLDSLKDIIGQQQVKDLLSETCIHMQVNQARGATSYAGSSQLDMRIAPGHYLFRGNSGSGKTTIARKLAESLSALGIIGKYEPLRVTGQQLQQAFMDGQFKAVDDIIQRAMGGVLFVDEAHQLRNTPHVLRSLLDPMIDRKYELCVIFGCYSSESEAFLALDSGLESRITKIFDFHDYTPEELRDILAVMSRKSGYILEEGLPGMARDWFEAQISLARTMGAQMQNARLAEKLLAALQRQSSIRLRASLGSEGLLDETLFTLTCEDMKEFTRLEGH